MDLLEEIHRFCQEHHIVYYLSSGTLLGAVRHGGYIPWDDDIDLYMPRESYERFVKEYYHSMLSVTKREIYHCLICSISTAHI